MHKGALETARAILATTGGHDVHDTPSILRRETSRDRDDEYIGRRLSLSRGSSSSIASGERPFPPPPPPPSNSSCWRFVRYVVKCRYFIARVQAQLPELVERERCLLTC